MSLDSTLRGLAAEIGKNRNPTGSVAAPAKLRHRTGTIDAYTAGALTASVHIGADVVDAPFIAAYTPAAGDTVSVLINNGSPLILGAVNKAPAATGIASAATYGQNSTATIRVSDYLNPVGWVDFTQGNYAADFDPSSLHFLTSGLFQIAAWASVDTTNGTNARLCLDPDASGIGNWARDADVVYQGTAWLYCISPLIPVTAGDALFPLWKLNEGDGTAHGTTVSGQIRVVKFAG